MPVRFLVWLIAGAVGWGFLCRDFCCSASRKNVGVAIPRARLSSADLEAVASYCQVLLSPDLTAELLQLLLALLGVLPELLDEAASKTDDQLEKGKLKKATEIHHNRGRS